MADSTIIAALVATCAQSSSVAGAFSTVPEAETVVATESQRNIAEGATTPVITCLTVATGGAACAAVAVVAAAGAAVRAVRSAARTKPMPLTKSAALTRNSQ